MQKASLTKDTKKIVISNSFRQKCTEYTSKIDMSKRLWITSETEKAASTYRNR